VKDANNLDELAAAYQNFLNTNDRPTLIVVDSHIGYGSPHKQTPTKRTANRSAKPKSSW